MSLNIIGDVHGQYHTLIKLIEKMPEGEFLIVGDLVDRGPMSKEVIEFVKNTPNVNSLRGNHESMLIDSFTLESPGHISNWIRNGGAQTAESFNPNVMTDGKLSIPKEIIRYLDDLPLYYETDDLIVTHAPISMDFEELKAMNPENTDRLIEFTWARWEPIKQKKFAIFGHNSMWGLRWFEDYAVCIDTSKDRILTGINWPSKTIYQQEFI